jgi:hypothetical protein
MLRRNPGRTLGQRAASNTVSSNKTALSSRRRLPTRRGAAGGKFSTATRFRNAPHTTATAVAGGAEAAVPFVVLMARLRPRTGRAGSEKPKGRSCPNRNSARCGRTRSAAGDFALAARARLSSATGNTSGSPARRGRHDGARGLGNINHYHHLADSS